MKSELLAKSPLLALPIGAFLLFIVVFMTVVIVTMKRKAPAYDPIARLPLLDDEDVGTTAAATKKEDVQESQS